jgi:Domain of unknown function (DUF222)/HNH endonuclease
MDIELVIEHVQLVAAARASDDVTAIKAGLRSVTQLRGWLAASEAALTAALKPKVSFPEKDVADCTRTSLGEATKTTERSETLAAVPEFADALDRGAVTQGHVDEITKHTKGLDDSQRAELFERAAGLVPVAASGSVREFGKRLDQERRAVERGDGLDKLARQRRKVEFRDWTDAEGMYCYGGRLDPLAAIAFKANLDAQIRRQFAAGTPDTAPDDPLLRQRHLAGLALAHLVGRPGANGTSGSEDDAAASPIEPDVIVVVDASQPDGAGGPDIDWGLPVEVPLRVLAELVAGGHATVHTVVVRNGVVLHAPGNLNLGRTARLANRAQRRAVNALYSTCAIPGCGVHFRYTKMHHVVEWDNSGRTDLENLLPVCPHHHTLIHQQRWHITLGANRELTIRYPDGSIQTTGPPSRAKAA